MRVLVPQQGQGLHPEQLLDLAFLVAAACTFTLYHLWCERSRALSLFKS